MRKPKMRSVAFALMFLAISTGQAFVCLAEPNPPSVHQPRDTDSQARPNRPPIADAGRDVVTGVSVETWLWAYGSSEDEYIVKYEWDFDGDGQYDWESAEKGVTSHIYRFPGTYHAIFRVTDSQGNVDIDMAKVIVEGGRGTQEFLEETVIEHPEVQSKTSDGITKRYVVMINGGSESRFWDDVTFMYSTLTDDYGFTPESIYLFNYDGNNPSGVNPDNMIDYPARRSYIDSVFSELGGTMDGDDELFVWVTDHGRGYHGLQSQGGKYYGYLDGHASVDPGDEKDYLEIDFRLRSFFTGGDYCCNHGMEVWQVYYKYYDFGNYRMWRNKYVSHFTNVYFEELGATRSDSDVFIERFLDYLVGDYNRNGIIETDEGEVYDSDGDGNPPYDPGIGFDEDDWGYIDHCDDDVTHISTSVGDRYMIFDADLDNHVDIDINFDIGNLEVDGTDLDNQGLFDGIDVNDDGDMSDWVSIDEKICLRYTSDDLLDDELAVFLDRINAKVISIFMEPCFSGGFIDDLSAPNRVISTATIEEAVSWGNLFVRNFTSAFHKADPWGNPVDADYNSNGFISMQEAFNYACSNDYYDEIPQYDDNGDGVSHTCPIPHGGDGELGANVYLLLPTLDVALCAGWNMISWPGEPKPSNVDEIVAGNPDVLPYFYTWDQGTGGYILVSEVKRGDGYWIAATQDCSLRMCYIPVYELTRPLVKGWNMVGSGACAVPVSSLTSSPPYHLPYVYTWDCSIGGYKIVDDMLSTVGHWVAATDNCDLTMPCSASPLVEDQPSVDVVAPTWKSTISVGNQELVFGMHPSASDGFDRLLDKPLPPPPVAPSDEVKKQAGKERDDVLRAAWQIKDPDFPMLWESYVKDSPSGVWGLSVEFSKPGKIEWSDLPEGYRCMLHYDKRSIDMHTKKFLPLPAGEHSLTLVLDASDSLPGKTQLLANYPNPFNPETWIPYELEQDSNVEIRIYSATGQLVRVLNLGHRPAGFYTAKDKAAYWDGKNEAGEDVASGIYFYTVQAGDFTATKKMVIAR